MIRADDWRLLNDAEMLRGQYLEPMTDFELQKRFPGLKHCMLCLERIQPYRQIWFLPADAKFCICEMCFRDFAELLQLHETDDFF